MKTQNPPLHPRLTGISLLAALGGLLPLGLQAQKAGKEVLPVAPVQTMETQMDLPTSFHKYYGQRINGWRDTERSIAKVDLDSDLNMDGVMNNNDPQDGGAFEGTPPGLQVGVGEMTRMAIRITPYRVDFDGEVVVSLELAGINRSSATGEFDSFESETASTGRIRVWRDAERKILLLDSADPNRRYVEFSTQYREYPYNLPTVIPRAVFVEGVKASSQYDGDLRVLLTCSHRAPGTTPENFAESRKKLIKSFRTTFDHILLTVRPEPLQKEFVNNNAEGNWIRVQPLSSK